MSSNDAGRPDPCRVQRLAPGAILSFLLAISAGTAFTGESRGFVIKADGLSYYLFLRSVFFDRDIDFTNEIADHGLRPNAIEPGERTPTGLIGNPFSVGPSILWTPFFLVAHAGVLAARGLAGSSIPADGFSWPYAAAIELASVAYAFAGFLLTARFCRRRFDEETSIAAVGFLLLASPWIYYGSVMATMSHSMSVFAVSCLLVAWRGVEDRPSAARAFLLGAAAGLVAIVRWQDAIVLLFPVLAGWRRPLRPPWVFAFSAGLALALAPQLAAWRILYGEWLTIPQGGGFLFSTFHPLRVLFSFPQGLLVSHPVLAVGLAGLVLLGRSPAGRDAREATAALALVAAYVLVNASVAEWWAGRSFGARRFLALVPFFALGLCEASRRMRDAGLSTVSRAAAVILVAWNLVLLVLYQTGRVPRAAP